MVTSSLPFWWELYRQRGSDAFIRPQVRDVWDRYVAYVEAMPERERHVRVHDGHMQPAERQFVTPELIRATGGLVGEPDEIIAMLRERERAGLKEVTLLPPMASAANVFAPLHNT